MAYAFVGGPVGSAPVAWQPVGAPLKAYSLAADTGSYTETGVAVAANYGSNPSVGSYAVTGNAAAVTRTRIFHVSTGAYDITGYDAELDEQHQLYVAQGSYDITGYPAGLAHYNVIYPDKGTYSYTGVDATFGITVTEEGGDYLITGNAVNFLKGYRVNLSAGSYTWTVRFVDMQQSGYPILYTQGGNYDINFKTFIAYSMKALFGERGQFRVQGKTVFLSFGYALRPEKGIYSVVGRPVNFPISMPAESGFYDFIGQDVYRDVRYNPPDTGHYTYTGRGIVFNIGLPCDTGVYRLSTNSIVFSHNYRLSVQTTQFTVTDNNVVLVRAAQLLLIEGTYSVGSIAQSMNFVRRSYPVTGNYVVGGNDAELDEFKRMYLIRGSYTVTGRDVRYIYISQSDLYDGDHMIIIPYEERMISVSGT